jgi:MFS family permease
MPRIASHIPFAPVKLPFFYGWAIVGAATIGIVMSIPGQTMGVSVFTDHLIKATGLTRLELTYTYLIGTLASSLLLPRGGVFLDKHGSRFTAAVACVLVSATLCVMTQLDALALIFAKRGGFKESSLIAGVLLTLGFMMLRFSGQGMLTIASRTMLAKWFERRRGFVSGLSGVFVSGGFAIAPVFLQWLIDVANWRNAWLILAGLVGLGMTTIALLFYREDPEECGLRMDGDAPAAHASNTSEGDDRSDPPSFDEEPSYTRAEALRTARFWYVTLALTLQAMVFTGVTFHIMDIGVDTGIGGREAVRVFIPNAIVSTSVGMLAGWLADRVPVRTLVLAFMSFQIIAYIGAGRLGEPVFMVMMIVGWGCAGGLFATLMNVAMPNFFGRRHLGAISSVQMSCMVAGSALGPAMLAAAKTYLGSYRVGLLWSCALSAGVFLFALLAPSPQPRRS